MAEYNIWADGKPDPERVLGTMLRIYGERFGLKTEIVGMHYDRKPGEPHFAYVGARGAGDARGRTTASNGEARI